MSICLCKRTTIDRSIVLRMFSLGLNDRRVEGGPVGGIYKFMIELRKMGRFSSVSL